MDVVDLPHADVGPRSALPIVLMHGYPLDHRMWGPAQRAVADAGHRVLVPDLRGFGKAPVRPVGTMEAHAADVLRMLDRAGARRFAVAGFSMGGYAALALAKLAPDRLAGLALVDTRAEPDSPEAAAKRAENAKKVAVEGMPVVEAAMMPGLLTPAAPADVVALTRQMILGTPKEGAIAALHGMAARADMRPFLPTVRAPTLIVVGEHDPITPPEAARAMAAAIPGAMLVVVPGAAHLSPLEKPEAVNAALVAWAASLR